MKRQKHLLKNNETIYNDKVPISTRFYLQLLKKSQFLKQFTEAETYEYASENEKGTVTEVSKNRSKKLTDKTYNLRSSEAKTERKSYGRFRTQKAKRNETQIEGKELKRECKRIVEEKARVIENEPPIEEGKLAVESMKSGDKQVIKELFTQPLAPIIEEIRNREPLKLKGLEIDKIAEKLKSLVKLDKELLVCKESFDEENIKPAVAVKTDGKI